MAHDALEALVRLRHLAVDQARRALADCLAAETTADSAAAALEAQVEHEADAAASLTTEDADVEAFAVWLRRIRPEQEAVHRAQDEAALATARARAVLSAAHAAAQAAEEMLQHHVAARRIEAERQAQQEIDEAAGACRPDRG